MSTTLKRSTSVAVCAARRNSSAIRQPLPLLRLSLMTDPNRPPVPPFTLETATKKVKAAEDAWNTCNPQKVATAYTTGPSRCFPNTLDLAAFAFCQPQNGRSTWSVHADSQWRNRDEFFQGREAIEAFLTRKWQKELQYKLMKELWCYQGNRISVRFEYEYHDHGGQWWRAHGNEVSYHSQACLDANATALQIIVCLHAVTPCYPDACTAVTLVLT